MTEKTLEQDPFDISADELPPFTGELDRSRPYGTTAGEPVKRYFQDGKYFDYQGKLVEEV